MAEIPVGHSRRESVPVDGTNLASAVGSGMVDVFATPMMVALFETAASNCVAGFLNEGEVSVGVGINVAHSAPTVRGMTVTATATVTAVDRRSVSFDIEVTDDAGVVGSGTHTRFVVDREKFMAKARERGGRE